MIYQIVIFPSYKCQSKVSITDRSNSEILFKAVEIQSVRMSNVVYRLKNSTAEQPIVFKEGDATEKFSNEMILKMLHDIWEHSKICELLGGLRTNNFTIDH